MREIKGSYEATSRNPAISAVATEDLICIVVQRIIEERNIGVRRVEELLKELKSARKESEYSSNFLKRMQD